MRYPSRIVLHVPVQDEAALEPFVEKCIADKVELIAVVGEGCQRVEDIIDELVVGDGSDTSRFVVTTSHPDESVQDVLEFARMWVGENRRDGVLEVKI